jgi:hypothetical protein
MAIINNKELPPVKYKKPFIAVFRRHPLSHGYNSNNKNFFFILPNNQKEP